MQEKHLPVPLEEVFRQAFTQALEKMDPQERQAIERMIGNLTGSVRNFGRVSAIDTLGKVALFLTGKEIPANEADLRKLFEVQSKSGSYQNPTGSDDERNKS